MGLRSDEDSLGRPCPFARRELRGASALSEQEHRDTGGWHRPGPADGTDLFSEQATTPHLHIGKVRSQNRERLPAHCKLFLWWRIADSNR